MTDALDDVTLGLLGDVINHGIALFTITGVDSYFDQLVGLQGLINFQHDRVSQAMLTDDHHDFFMMGKLAQLFELFLRNRHRAIIN